MKERESLCESLREIAESIVDTSTQEGKTLLRAAAEIDRLMRVYTAAADFVDDPFGSLDVRKFYVLRESFYPLRDE